MILFNRMLPSHFLPTNRLQSLVRRTVYSSINCNTPFNICFVRHGQSTWNRDNRFIGWTDTPLTEDGVLEARVAGRMLQSSGILFDEAHTVSRHIMIFWIVSVDFRSTSSHLFVLCCARCKTLVSPAPLYKNYQSSFDGNGSRVHPSEQTLAIE